MSFTISMGKMLSQKLQEDAQASFESEVLPELMKLAKNIVEQALKDLKIVSSEQGKTSVAIECNDPKDYDHRDHLVLECLTLLPIDIGCRISETNEILHVFLLRFDVVDSFEGGRVQYDFPVWRLIRGIPIDNLHHLETLDLEGDDLRDVKAFEIILRCGLGYQFMESALEWGLKNPQFIVDLVDPEGFFQQFRDEKLTIETQPFTISGDDQG